MRPRPSPVRPEHVYGQHAANAVLSVRPQDVLRVAVTAEGLWACGDLVRDAAASGIPCVELDDRAMARATESVHHEGICLTVRPRPVLEPDALFQRLGRSRGAVIALDRVGNPHNLGGVVRSAAYFGLDGVLFAHGDGPARLTPAAVRIAEGGAEHIAIAAVEHLAPALQSARRRGVHVVGTDPHARDEVFSIAWPWPCVVVIGNEREGLSPAVRALCSATVSIPGAGRVDSLNASVATGVVLAELARTRPR